MRQNVTAQKVLLLVITLLLLTGGILGQGQGGGPPPWARNGNFVQLGLPSSDLVVIGTVSSPQDKVNIAGNLRLNGTLNCGLGSGCVGGAALQANSVSSSHLQANSVSSNHLQAGSVGSNHLQANSVSSSHLQTNSVSTNHLQNGAVSPGKIAPCTAANQILKWNGTTWACDAAPIFYTPGAGLTLTGTTFSVDTNAIQARVTGTCPSGSALQTIGMSGAVTCQNVGAGTITAVNTPAGSGLQGGGTNGALTLSLLPCAANQTLQATGSTWACAPYNVYGPAPGGGLTLIPNQPNQLFSLMPCQPGFLQILVWQAPATATSSWSCVPYSPAKGSGLSLGTDLSLGIMPCGPPPNQILLWNGQSWNCAPANEQVSDRNVKENFTTVNGRDVLGRLSQIPITRWEYIGEGPEIWHIGPMAQDFYAAFGLGEDDKHINSVDANGIALLSIQALYEISLEKDKQIQELQAFNTALQARLAALEKEMQELKALLRK